ncbi:MAG: hypothetical protein ACYSWU_06400 [Planctomycetota bacterium]|jgi:hypothetical protein
MEHSKTRTLKWIAAGIIVCAFLVVDFVTPTLWGPDPEWLLMVPLGICIGQVNLIATWAALAPGNFVVRLPWSLLLGVLMWYSLVLGCRVAEEYRSFYLNEAVVLGIVLLFGILVAQVPLWIARKLFRWRLVSWAGKPAEPSEGRLQFQLWHMFVGMLFVSVALSPARVVLPSGDIGSFDPYYEELFVLIPAIAISNLLIAVPCVWGAFLPRRTFLPLAVGWLLYCGLLTALEFASLVAILGPPGEDQVPFWMYLVNISQCITVFGTLLVFRALGFRLLRVSKPDQARGQQDESVEQDQPC